MVQDSGIGMDADLLNEVNSKSHPVKNLGFGIPVSRKLIDLNRGQILFQVKDGTKVIFSMSVDRAMVQDRQQSYET